MEPTISRGWVQPGTSKHFDEPRRNSAFVSTWPRAEPKPQILPSDPPSRWVEGYGVEEARRRDVKRSQKRNTPRSFGDSPFDSALAASDWREKQYAPEADAVAALGRRRFAEIPTNLAHGDPSREITWHHVKLNYAEKS